MVSNIVLSSALRGTLNSINRTQDTIDAITQRLATGKDVSGALDNPDNFFTARTLRNTASDQNRLLDGINQGIQVIKEGLIGLEAVETLINQAESIVGTSKEHIEAGTLDPAVFEKIVNSSPQPLNRQILQGLPDVYYRLNETGGPIVDSGFGAAGPVAASYLGGASAGAAPLYTNDPSPSVDFDGANDRIQVADSTLINLGARPARTVELVFNADTTAGRQVIFEEGAGVNGFTIYLDNGLFRVTGEDDQGGQRWADADISAAVVAGQTYHAAFVYDSATDSFTGFLDGVNIGSVSTSGAANFPSHSGNIGIGAAVDGVQFHDGESGAGFRFDGRISNVAIYNRALADTELASHANALNATTSLKYLNRDYNNVLDQLSNVVIDSHYRGINLLAGDDLVTNFNSTYTSSLRTKGVNFSSEGFGFLRSDFNDLNDVEVILDQLRDAREQIREFGTSLVNSLSIIETRDSFTRENINTQLSGADDLTLADINREGAHLLASQTRLNLGVTALGLAAASQRSVISLF